MTKARLLAAALTALVALSACKTSTVASAPAAADSRHLADTRTAKDVFGHLPTPAASLSSQSFGSYAKGCQAGAVQLPETGPTWQAMRLSRNRNWSQPQTVGFLQDLSRYAATLPGWNGLYIGDMSQPRGGPMLTGHASHQTGLDADIWMLPAQSLSLTRAEREAISSRDMQRAGGAYTNTSWTPAHEALLKRAAEDPRVARIFIFPGAKVAMCDHATGDRTWLRKIRPWAGHNTHFHVRLSCPAGAAYCQEQDPIPAGDGCDEARAWVDGLLNPKPRDPNAPAPQPSRPLRVADLPAQCSAVIAAQ